MNIQFARFNLSSPFAGKSLFALGLIFSAMGIGIFIVPEIISYIIAALFLSFGIFFIGLGIQVWTLEKQSSNRFSDFLDSSTH